MNKCSSTQKINNSLEVVFVLVTTELSKKLFSWLKETLFHVAGFLSIAIYLINVHKPFAYMYVCAWYYASCLHHVHACHSQMVMNHHGDAQTMWKSNLCPLQKQ